MGFVKGVVGLICILPLVLSGCGPKRIDLVQSGFITVRTEADEGARLVVRAQPDGEQLRVRVYLSSPFYQPRMAGHIDVSLISPDGDVVERQKVTRISAYRRGSRYASWRLLFAHLPPPHSTLVVQYHRRHES